MAKACHPPWPQSQGLLTLDPQDQVPRVTWCQTEVTHWWGAGPWGLGKVTPRGLPALCSRKQQLLVPGSCLHV